MRPMADAMVTALASGPKSSADAVAEAASGSGQAASPTSLLSPAPSGAASAAAEPLPLHPPAASTATVATTTRETRPAVRAGQEMVMGSRLLGQPSADGRAKLSPRVGAKRNLFEVIGQRAGPHSARVPPPGGCIMFAIRPTVGGVGFGCLALFFS